MKRNILFITAVILLVSFSSCSSKKAKTNEAIPAGSNSDKHLMGKETNNINSDIKPAYLTTAEFKSKVWDYDANPQSWNYKGDLPCVIDFYADWCKPCKIVAPIMDELADYYNGRVIIYKVNTDKERELASVFQINSIPSILFSPLDGKPAIQPGALTKEDYIRIIDEFVLKINNEKS
ncbi:MAG: redoxin domain-containing protein [Bacteroidetes bacterium]|nr:redoxin domain-containing protein [Bacteroidota bacterium]